MAARPIIMFSLFSLVLLSLLALHCSSVSAHSKVPQVKAVFQGNCESGSICEQLCDDLENGGFDCYCKEGYSLNVDGFSCSVVPPPPVPQIQHPVHIQQGEQVHIPLQPVHDKNYHEGSSDGLHEYLQTFIRTKKVTNHDDQMLGDGPVNYRTALVEEKRKHRVQSGALSRKNKHRNRQKADPVNELPRHPIEEHEEKTNTFDENRIRVQEHTRAPVKFPSCEELICRNDGRCIPDEMRGGVRCQCPYGKDGDHCEMDIEVRYPMFKGTGYVAFPVLKRAYKEFTITLEFRPMTRNGLLLFSSEHPNARSDFFSLALVNGHAELRFDCGTGMALIKSRGLVELGEWNTLTVHRDEWNGWLSLNNEEQVKGRSKGLYSRITFREDLFLGGYKNLSAIGGRTGMSWGFVGCIRLMELNNKLYDMRKGAFVGDAIYGSDVSDCSAHVCDNVNCNTGTCVAESPDSHVCLCPMGTTGLNCERRITVHVPSFNGSSYIQFTGLRRTVLSYTEIEIVFKPMDRDGLILYNGYTEDRNGDFIALSMVNGHLEYRFDLGTGPAIIRSHDAISLNQWHYAKISRTGRDGILEVDDQRKAEGMSMGAYTQLTLTLDLFIGGHRNYDEMAKYSSATKSFTGCIQKVVVNDRLMNLVQGAIGGINIGNCEHPCVGQPCLNMGMCLPQKDFYRCSCPLGYGNTNCEEKLRDPVSLPMFQGDSYLRYTDKELMERVTGSKIDIQVKVRATGPNGLIFWNSEEQMSSSSDYISLGLRDGHVVFLYNLGSGEAVISYNETRIDDGKWHRIRAQRYEQLGYLEIDGTEIVEGQSPGTLKQLNTNNLLYLGGMDDIAHKTMRRFTTGFVGCISNFTLATDFHINIIDQATDGQNIRQCA